MSLDVSFNKITSLRRLLEHISSLGKLKHLTAAGNPLCLLPYYRLVVLRQLPTLQILDEQPVTESELADAQLVDHSHLEVPSHVNVSMTFSEVTYLKRLLIPLAQELPTQKMVMKYNEATKTEEEVEVTVTDEERIDEVARQGNLFLRIALPSDCNGAFPGGSVDTNEIPIEEPPPEDPVPAKGGKPGKVEEPPPKPPGEPLNLSGLRRPLTLQEVAAQEAAAAAAAADGEPAEAETAPPPTDAPLFFPIPLADGPNGVAGLLELREWLRLGLRIRALYKKRPAPVDADAAPPTADDPDAEAVPPVPEAIEPQLIGGGVLSLSSALSPVAGTVSEERREDGKLPNVPPSLSLGQMTLVLSPYAKWLEPDVQVPEAPQSKSFSDVSASVSMEVVLYAKEPATPEPAAA